MKKILVLISLTILLISSCQTLNIIVPSNLRSKLVKNMDEDRNINPLYREFRGAWFSTVANIDWPVRGGNESEQKKLVYIQTVLVCAMIRKKMQGGSI